MAVAVEDRHRSRECLERVLVINPGNERVRRLLGKGDTNGRGTPPDTQGTQGAAGGNRPAWRKVALAVVMLVGAVLCCLNPGDMLGIESGTEPNELDAYAACKHFVRQHLRAPRTAKFPMITEVDWASENDLWGIEGYVDAENTFGAKVREYYNCQVRYDSADDDWRLEGLEFY